MRLLAIPLRAVVLACAMLLSGWLFALATGGPDANIGAGLFAFTVVAVLATGWAFRDGRAGAAFGPLALRWAFVALLVAVGGSLAGIVQEPDSGAGLSDLALLATFILALVLVPALLGVGVGSTTRPTTSQDVRPT